MKSSEQKKKKIKAKKTKSKKKAKKPLKPTYLREVQIKFKKKRVKSGSPVGKRITDAGQIFELFSDLQNEAKEKVITISLDIKLKIICFEVISIGSIKSIYLRPVEALRASIPLNPYGIIMVHNHPSGDPTPSRNDKKFTSQLLINTRSLGIEFHDHIIIGDGTFYSFLDEGLMASL